MGKSSITERLLAGLVGFGMRAVLPGDVKGEYAALVEALGGTVWRLGRGLHSLNPLGAGPLRAAHRCGRRANPAVETLRARRLPLLDALVTIVRRDEPDVIERQLLGATLDRVIDHDPSREPLIPDILDHLARPTEELRRITDSDDYAYDVRIIKLRQKVSGCLRTLAGATEFCAIRSYLATASKHGLTFLDALVPLAQGRAWLPTTA